MRKILTCGGNILLEKLMQIPPDLPQLKAELDSGIYTAEDVTTAAIQYLDNCFDEQIEESPYTSPVDPTTVPALHSTYVFDLVQLLLDYGLNPNAVHGFDIHELRNHRNFTFGLSWVPCRGKNWSLHIFDKRTLWEVARL